MPPPVAQSAAAPPAAAPAELAVAIDHAALKTALNEGAARAMSCKKPEDPAGPATVVVTFAPSGRVTRALVNGPPFAGTATGGCIASTMRSVTIPAFSGDYVSVRKTIIVE
jgi:hypothetical protein